MCFSFLLAIPFPSMHSPRFTYLTGFFLLNPLGCSAQFLCSEKRESSLCTDSENFFCLLTHFQYRRRADMLPYFVFASCVVYDITSSIRRMRQILEGRGGKRKSETDNFKTSIFKQVFLSTKFQFSFYYLQISKAIVTIVYWTLLVEVV